MSIELLQSLMIFVALVIALVAEFTGRKMLWVSVSLIALALLLPEIAKLG